MAEYIERETVIKVLKDNVTEMERHIYFGSNLGIPDDEIEDIVNEIPTADVVEVVRCKNCQHYNKRYHRCNLHSEEPDQYSTGFIFEMQEDNFCSCGERRNG